MGVLGFGGGSAGGLYVVCAERVTAAQQLRRDHAKRIEAPSKPEPLKELSQAESARACYVAASGCRA